MSSILEDMCGVGVDSGGGVIEAAHCSGCMFNLG